MTVQSIHLFPAEIPAARAKVGVARSPEAPAGATSSLATQPDRAILSDQARRVAAALAGQEDAVKLHLSPRELRALVMRAEPSAAQVSSSSAE
jgi:hypothetical protein